MRRDGALRAARALAALVLATAQGLASGAPLAADRAARCGLDAEERSRVLLHGPWPPPFERDPTNRASGEADAIAAGRRLFFDKALSSNATLSCASCHDPARGFTDGLPRAQGLARHDRNAQTLLDVALQRWFGWDGGADSLWAASLRPLLAPGEMGSDVGRIAARVRADPGTAVALARIFPGSAESDEALAVAAAKAIAAYLETLRSPRTVFDAFRDALERGDARAAAAYPRSALRGLKIFVGRGNCWVCHAGPGFGNGEFHDAGVPFVVEPGRVDPGRYRGIERVRADRFNLLGSHNDQRDAAGRVDERALKTRTVTLAHRHWGEWRTPTLRSLGATAPYAHDGRFATLRDVVRHYSELDPDRLHADGEALLAPLRLSDDQVDDVVAFLRSLDAVSAPAAPSPGPARANARSASRVAIDCSAQLR